MRKCTVTLAVVLLCLTAPTLGVVTFTFDPVDFFNYKALSEGFSTSGGMFKLHKTWGGDMYRSWNAAGRPTVDNFTAGLGAGEGICGFNIWLANQANAPLWGETLVSSGSYVPSGTAGSGWTVSVDGNPWPAGSDGTWLVEWSTTDPNKYIRPGNSVGAFSFTFDPTTPVTLGDSYTIWFGGVNYGTAPSLVFDAFTGGFESQFIDPNGYGSGFEATLWLEAIPEPASMGLLALGGLALIRRRRKQGEHTIS